MTRTLLLLTTLVTASPAVAEVPELSAGLGYASDLFSARGYDAFSARDSFEMYRLTAAAAFPTSLGVLDAELAVQGGGVSDKAHVSVPSMLELHSLQVGGRWRWPWMAHLHPYAQLSAGWDWVSVTLLDTSRLTQTVGHVSGSGVLGVQLPFRMGSYRSREPTFVLDAGVGYTLRPSYAFNALGPAPQAKPPADAIAHGTVNLGTLPLSGVTFRVLASFRM